MSHCPRMSPCIGRTLGKIKIYYTLCFLGQWDIFILLFQTFIKIKSKKKSKTKNI